jgi:hypothetical protein
MKPSQPDDAGSPSPGQPPRPESKPLAPAVVYALDCLERGTPAQVRRHLIAVGYSVEEAADAVRQALAQQETDRPSAWAPEDAVARRCMSVGFILLMTSIVAGCLSVKLSSHLPDGAPFMLNVVIWCCLIGGVAVFLLGIAQKGIRRP